MWSFGEIIGNETGKVAWGPSCRVSDIMQKDLNIILEDRGIYLRL